MHQTSGLLPVATLLPTLLAALLFAGCDGASAELVVERAPVRIADVWAAAPDDAWGVGIAEQGPSSDGIAPGPRIMHYDGESWTTAWESWPALSGVWGSSRDDVWAVGASVGVPAVAHFDGREWSIFETGLPFPESWFEQLEDVSGSGPNDVWAVGYTDVSGAGEALVMRFDGTRWILEPGPPEAVGLIGVQVTSDGTVWALSAREGVFRRDGATWTHFDPALPLDIGASLKRIGEADGRIWIAGESGIAVFEDGAFVRLDPDAPMNELRGRDALVRGDLRVFTTFDHAASSCTFSGCVGGMSTEIATVHMRGATGERTFEIESIAGEPREMRSVSLSGVAFFATDAELWVLGPSYWRVAL